MSRTDLPSRLGLFDIGACAPPTLLARNRFWRISQRADCQAVLRNPAVDTIDILKELRIAQRLSGVELSNLAVILGSTMVARQNPFHKAARAFVRDVHAAGSARMLESATAYTEAQLPKAAAGEPFDAVVFTHDLMRQAVADGLGIDAQTVGALDTATHQIMVRWAGVYADKAALVALDAEASASVELMQRLIETAREGPLHEAVTLGTETYDFEPAEIASIYFFVIQASLDTTASFLANIFLLMQHAPEFAAEVRSPTVPRAKTVDEALRLLGPVRNLGRRWTSKPITVAGVTLPAGARLWIDIEAGHHDATAYPSPWTFDPGRRGPTSLGFSMGAHACLGAAVARLIAARLIDSLMAYDVTAMTDAVPQWGSHPGFRMPESVPCRLTPARARLEA